MVIKRLSLDIVFYSSEIRTATWRNTHDGAMEYWIDMLVRDSMCRFIGESNDVVKYGVKAYVESNIGDIDRLSVTSRILEEL
jgi:hypothetical protein